MSQKDRRDFLLRIGSTAGICAIGYQGGAALRSLVPNVSYDAPTTVKVGLPSEFPEGLKFLPDLRLFVFREGNVFHAISAVCTHLGCTVRAEALSQPETKTVDGTAAAAHAPLPVSVPRVAVRGRRIERRRSRAAAARLVPPGDRARRRPVRRRPGAPGRSRLPPDAVRTACAH